MSHTALAGEDRTIGAGARRYFRVLLALLRREEQIRRKAPMESIANLLEPVLMIGTLSFFWWFIGRRNIGLLGGSPILFYGTGFFSLYFFIYISRRMGRSIESPRRRFPIEQRLDHIVVHIILRIADYSILGVLVFGTMYFFVTPAAIPHDIVPVAQACAAIIMLGFGWGIITVIVSRASRIVGRVIPAFNRSLILVSGAMFIPDFLAPSVRYVLSFNPLLHAIALFRQGFYPSYPTLILDTTYLAWSALFVLAFGLVLERVTQRVSDT